MSDTPHLWDGNHYCARDAQHLMYHTDGNALRATGYPALDPDLEHQTYCSFCLRWFPHPADHDTAGSDTRSPQKGQPDG